MAENPGYKTEEHVRQDLDKRFTYHPPKPGQPQIYESLRNIGKGLARAIVELTPASREQSIALTKLEEAIMWANAGLARNT